MVLSYYTPARTPWFVVPTLQSCPIFWGRATQPCVITTSIFYSPDFPTCHPSWTAAAEVCTPTAALELWHSCLAGLGEFPAPGPWWAQHILQPPGSCLGHSFSTLGNIPKSCLGWGGEASLQPNSSSSFKNYKRKKKKPQPCGCINANTLLAAQAGREGWTQPREEWQEHRARVPQPHWAWNPVLGARCQAGDTGALPGEMSGRGLSCGNSNHYPRPPRPTQFTFGFWTLPAEPKVSLESWPNWHSSYSPLHSSYVISSVAQRRKGSSGFLSVGTMLHPIHHHPKALSMPHFSQC